MSRLERMRVISAVFAVGAGSAASAQVVDFVFPTTGGSGFTIDQFTDAATGLSLTISNPRDNVLFGNQTFGYLLGGLFIDGGFAPTVDWTFSESVRLIEYQIGNDDFADLFTLTQGAVVSADNTTVSVSTFPFTNVVDTFAGGEPIVLTTSDHSPNGYSIARVRVEIVEPRLINDVYIARLSDEFTFPNEPGTVIPDMARPGPDFVGNWFNSVGYNVEGRTIEVSNISSNVLSYAGGVEFAFLELSFDDPDTIIVGATVESATGPGWELITDADLSVTEDSLVIDASVLGTFTSQMGQSIRVRLIPGPRTPECAGDIADDFGALGNEDGQISFGDFLALLGLVGPCP